MAKVKEIFNMHPTAIQNTEEIVFQVNDDTVNAVIDFQERNFQGDSLQIFTATGSGGTQLVQDTDYVIEDINEYYTGVTGVDIYRKIRIINATYHAVDLYIPVSSLSLYGDFVDETDINRLQDQIDVNEDNIDAILSGTAQALLGQEVILPYSEDLSQYGLLQYTFDTVSTSRYPEWYAKIGDTFEQQHLDAGQPASGEGYFYPTPVPGAYGRSALPNIELTDSNFSSITNLGVTLPDPTSYYYYRAGIAFKFVVESGTAPTGMTDGETYYLNFNVSGQSWIFPTETDAINSTNPITYTDSGSGTFKLTQEGLSLDDAFQAHRMGSASYDGGSANDGTADGESVYGASLNLGSSNTRNRHLTKDFFSDGTNGDPRTSNETRPDTTIKFYYIKVENVIPFVGEPVSGVKYEYERGDSTTWNSLNLTINHNLDTDFKDLSIIIETMKDGVWSWQRVENVTAALTGGTAFGVVVQSIELSPGVYDPNNFTLITGEGGIRTLLTTGADSSLSDGQTGNLRVIVEKKNYSSPILDQPKYTNQTYTLGDGDTISLTAQTSILLVDSTTADMSIDITGYSYNGHKVIVKNIGTANKCTVTNSIGGWLKDATVPYGQSASCEVANDELTEGDFLFLLTVGDGITYGSTWVQAPGRKEQVLSIKNGKANLQLSLASGTNETTAITFNNYFPVESMVRYGVSATAACVAIINTDGTVEIFGYSSGNVYIEASWDLGI